jgi:hypothetical protein
MRVARTLATSLALIALAGPCSAHGAEELGHHWYVPAYRIEMQTQIALMAAVALAVLAASWLAKVIRTRRSRG